MAWQIQCMQGDCWWYMRTEEYPLYARCPECGSATLYVEHISE